MPGCGSRGVISICDKKFGGLTAKFGHLGGRNAKLELWKVENFSNFRPAISRPFSTWDRPISAFVKSG